MGKARRRHARLPVQTARLAYPVYRLGKPYTMILRPDTPRVEKRDAMVVSTDLQHVG